MSLPHLRGVGLERVKLTYNLIMWDFKLKKTRIIFIASFVWIGLASWIIDLGGGGNIFIILLFNSPVLIYWIGIPLYRWIMIGK